MFKSFIFSLLFAFITISTGYSQSDCEDDKISLNIEFRTDDYGYEFSWQLLSDGTIVEFGPGMTAQYQNDTLYNIDLCLTKDGCYEIKFFDTYGDGFIDNGYLKVYVDDELIIDERDYGFFASAHFNCPEGAVCSTALPLVTGSYTQTEVESWYLVDIDTTGLYEISTCGSGESCSSTIWIYESCNNEITENNEGTIYYNTESDICGTLGVINAPLSAESVYYVRIKNQGLECDALQLDFTFNGTILGCTDPSSCNYNPLAIEDDGSCFPWEDPRCNQGPDLLLNQDVLEASMSLEQLDNNDGCLIEENCIKGYGIRDIIRFTTEIENIGNLDYFIGDPFESPGQFEFDQCHNHWHYDGYARYTLFDTLGNIIPIGYKNGFCVLDLVCPSFDMYTYGCDYMGITAGCKDIYDAYIDCQWLDITDIPAGDYVFVARVNEDLARDALGRPEMDTLNNSAQVCFSLLRDENGTPEMVINQDCEPYIDCAGDLYGNAEFDCNGVCNGSSVAGDIDSDQLISTGDIESYLISILNEIEPMKCWDLDDNGSLDIYDAALLKSCIKNGQNHEHDGGSTVHDHCTFPAGIYNDIRPFYVSMEQPENENFVDINILNENDGLLAFQFTLTGITITSVVEMSNSPDQIFDLNYKADTGMVMGLAIGDTGLTRSNETQRLVRVYFEELEGEICMNEKMIFSSDSDELVLTMNEEPCTAIVISSSEDVVTQHNISLEPNPSSSFVNITIGDIQDLNNYTVQHADGRIMTKAQISDNTFTLDVNSWSDGIYYLHFAGKEQTVTRKLVVQNSIK